MIALLFFYAVVPALQVYFFVQSQPFIEVGDLINDTFSIFCFYWILNNIVVTLKIPVLQNKLPFDARIRFHIVGTIGIAATLFYHAFYKLAIGKAIDLVSWSLLVLFVSIVVVSSLWIPLPGIRHLRSRVLNVLRRTWLSSYDVLKKIHHILFLSLALLMDLHVFQVGVFELVPPASTVLYHAAMIVAAGLYIYSRVRRRFLPQIEVQSVTHENGILTLKFKPNDRVRYKPGQFAFLRFERSDLNAEEHPFSFLSHPEDGELSFGVRALGDFTHTLKSVVPGDRAVINGGFGNFVIDAGPNPVFIGSGIGSVPFISMLKNMHAQQDNRTVKFHLAVKTEEEIPERERLWNLLATMPNVELKLLVSERNSSQYSVDYFREHIPNPAEHTYYICSSDRVRRVVETSLRELGVRKKAIRYEAFALG